jgi:hypothetical protein
VVQEDEDDPFYMPMMPAAIKMAEASKFSMLAQPLSPAEDRPFMIQMEAGVWRMHCSSCKLSTGFGNLLEFKCSEVPELMKLGPDLS